jgi:hypothetical protein
MFKTVVNFNTRIKEAASFGQPISEYDPASKGQQDFRSLAQEVIGAAEHPQVKNKRLVDSLADQLESIGVSANELLKSGKPAVIVERTRPAAAPEPAKPAVVSEPVKPVVAPELARPALVPQPVRSQEPVPIGKSLDVEKVVPAPIPVVPVPAPASTAPAKASQTIDEKLTDYYGVSQIQDAVVFVTLYPRAKSVQIAGDFNSWQPATSPMLRVTDSGVWQVKMKLPQGTYRYRLVVDGQWQQDPYNERTELNPYGELNSIIDVK